MVELLITNIFQGCRFPPDADLDALFSKFEISSLEIGLLIKDLIEDLDKTASVTFI